MTVNCVNHCGTLGRHERFLPELTWLQRLLDNAVLEMIRERRQEPSDGQDLLSRLLAVCDEETGTGLTNDEVKNEAITLLTAGHDTVGAAFSWFWQLWAQNSVTQCTLHDEIAGWLKGRSPTLDDMPNFPLLRAVFDETLASGP